MKHTSIIKMCKTTKIHAILSVHVCVHVYKKAQVFLDFLLPSSNTPKTQTKSCLIWSRLICRITIKVLLTLSVLTMPPYNALSCNSQWKIILINVEAIRISIKKIILILISLSIKRLLKMIWLVLNKATFNASWNILICSSHTIHDYISVC